MGFGVDPNREKNWKEDGGKVRAMEKGSNGIPS